MVVHPLDLVSASAESKAASFVERLSDGRNRAHLLVREAHCAACIHQIETATTALPGVDSARLNLSSRRLEVVWRGSAALIDEVIANIDRIGYSARAYDPKFATEMDRAEMTRMLRALAVAFFANSNVMMLSWAVWAGHFATMGEATRGFFHWLSALIAVPAILYAGLPFFLSALRALSRRTTNLDVPISLGVLLTTAMSLSETALGGPHVYFDGALSLLFVLLLGRTLELSARRKARSAVETLALMRQQPVARQAGDGRIEWIPAEAVVTGDVVHCAAGERLGVDGRIVAGTTQLDTALLDGESLPKPAGPGDRAQAGSLNLSAPILIEATEAGGRTSLAEMQRLLEAAEDSKGRYRMLADRVVRWYTPVVHVAALSTFLGWLLLADAVWSTALVHAVSVLIIACPCALGLAVPVTQIVAASRAMQAGVLLKSGSALERLAGINHIVFDKTGTLTTGFTLDLPHAPPTLEIAAGMAAASRHPYAMAVRAASPQAPALTGVIDHPGEGLEWRDGARVWRLGSAAFVGVAGGSVSGVWFSGPDQPAVFFPMRSELREGSATALAALRASGCQLEILSGDRPEAVEATATTLGLADWTALSTPAGKVAVIKERLAAGRSVLLVGDGLNDTAAMAAATASMAPADAADLTLRNADAVFLYGDMTAVPFLLKLARASQQVMRQSIGFSFLYNAIWVPVAMAGLVTPWVAALSMSASSLIVTFNALRLNLLRNPWEAR